MDRMDVTKYDHVRWTLACRLFALVKLLRNANELTRLDQAVCPRADQIIGITLFTDSSDSVELVLLLNRLTLDNFGHLVLISFWYRFFLASWRMMRIDRAAFILSFKDFHFDASSLWRSLSFMLWCRKMTKSIIENAITFRKTEILELHQTFFE